MIRVFICVACCALLTPIASGADRPTAEQVSKSVDEAYAAYRAKFPAKTQDQVLSEIQEKIDLAKDEIKNCKLKNRAERTEFISNRKKSIVAMEEEKKEVSKNYVEPKISPKLPRMEWNSMPIASIGRIDSVTGAIRCVQVVSPDSILATYEGIELSVIGKLKRDRDSKAQPSPEDFTSFKGPIVLLQKTDSSTWVEGQTQKFNENIVVVGRHTYESAGGIPKTVPVIEFFNPDEPFK